MEREFNLVDEPWIKVLNMSFETEEVSLRTLFEKAHLFRDLDGELETQNVSVLRMLVAILYSIFARCDTEGVYNEIEDKSAAVERWQNIWDLKKFPISVINRYLEQYHDRFWLFEDERPFYQVKEANVGSSMSAEKLNGAIAESKNKPNMFSVRAGDEKKRLSYAEAARWLLNTNDFDDTSGKTKEKSEFSLKRGWLGRLGLVIVMGENLFETLMLNLTLLKDGNSSIWEPIEGNNCAAWELECPQRKQRVQISVPGNPASLYTLQSRRLFLHKENGTVIGFDSAGGDFFDEKNAFNEQMTIWKKIYFKNKEWYEPAELSTSRHLWREFSSLTDIEKGAHCPGVVAWIIYLRKKKIISKDRRVLVKSISVKYEKPPSNKIKDIVCDVLSFHANIFDEKGNIWKTWIKNEISLCDRCASQVRVLAEMLLKASFYVKPREKRTDKEESIIISARENYEEEFYDRIDPVFREWLIQLDPNICSEEYIENLRNTVKEIVLQLGREMVDAISNDYIRGRYGIIEDDKGNLNRNYCTAPDAYNRFIYQINQIYGRN